MTQTIHEINLNFNSRTLANEIQVHVKISEFITLMLKQSDSLPIHREKVSVRTILPLAYNLTDGIYCAIEKPRKFASLVLNILTQSIALVINL